MPSKSPASDTEATSSASARFVVSLPKEVGTAIDALSARLEEQQRRTFGIGVPLSRAQVVQAVVLSALKTIEESENNTEGAGI